MNQFKVFTLILMLCLFFKTEAAEPEFLSVTKVKENVYNLYLNVAFVVGEEFVVLIESGYGEYKNSSEKILAAVKSITDKPIKYVINMHSHGDHNGGNVFFADRGATIITQKYAIYSADFNDKYPRTNLIRFDTGFELDLGNEVIEIEHMIAHTFVDGVIYLRNNNVMFIGESYKPNYITYLGMFGMDSFNAWGDKALSKLNEETIIVPSHGKTMLNKKQLLSYRANYRTWFDRVQALYLKGQTAEQISKDKMTLNYAAELNLDQNPKHVEHHEHPINGLIRYELDKAKSLNLRQMKTYLGQYQLKNKADIDVVIISGRLVAKQRNSFISWLKPIGDDQFELMTFYGVRLIFQRNTLGEINGIKTEFPKETRSREKLTGDWLKTN